MELDEQWVQRGATRLRVTTKRMLGPIRAEVLLTHGLGEHADRYRHVAKALATHGLRLWGYDLRGHGRSDGQRGDARYEELLEDLEAVAKVVRGEDHPVFFLGHSLGGQLVLRFLQEYGPVCRGAVILAPWLRLAFDPPLWQLVLARLAARLFPGWMQGTGAIADRLSRDQEHMAGLPGPELTHQQISARLFLAVQREGRRALERASEVTAPLLLLHGEADAVTSAAATREFFARAGAADKELVLYPGAMHELHNDLGRVSVLEAMAAWMSARVR